MRHIDILLRHSVIFLRHLDMHMGRLVKLIRFLDMLIMRYLDRLMRHWNML